MTSKQHRFWDGYRCSRCNKTMTCIINATKKSDDYSEYLSLMECKA